MILIGRTLIHNQEIFYKKIGRGNIKTQLYSSKSFDHYPQCKKHILFLHAFSGCDTTSSFFNKGKKTFVNKLEKLSSFDELAQPFQQTDSTIHTLFENGVRILLSIYNAPKPVDNIDHLRYVQFIKSTKLNKPVPLCSLPPTNAAVHQHINRVYYQVQTWLGNDLDPQQWGWVLQNKVLNPITTILPPAPEELLNTIFCNCKNGCGSRCGCRKAGLKCTSACGQCSGQACLNASSDHHDPDEEDYDPVILEALAELPTNADDEDYDNDMENIERPDEEDEEDEDEN